LPGIAADGTILDAILTSKVNDWSLNLTAFLSGHEIFVWWLHIAELTLQTLKKTWNCCY